MSRLQKILPIIIVLVSSFLAVFPLLHPGFPPTHDGEYHVVRFYEFDKTLRDGNIYPLWAADLNFKYGVPLFNYVYPLPNYMASIFHFFGASFIDAFKLNMFAATLVGAIGMYLWASAAYGKKSGVVASIFYTFAPYHFLDMYIRGSVGEVWALALFPVFLYFFHEACLFLKQRNFIIGGILFALIIFSHNILAVMFAGFALTYSVLLIFQSKHKQTLIKGLFLTFVLGLLLSAVFWLPALFEKQFVVGLNTSNVSSNFPELFQLLIPSWGSGFSGDMLGEQMSFQIGFANLLVVTIGIVTLFLKRVTKKSKSTVVFMYSWLGILIFMILPVSSILWGFPLLEYFQFSWRLLSLVILICAFLAGYVVSVFKNNLFAIALVIFVALTTFSYAHPPYYFNRGDSHYTSRPNFIYGTNSPGDFFNTKWMQRAKKIPSVLVVPKRSDTNIKLLTGTTTRYLLETHANAPDTIKINLAYFPGWEAQITEKRIPIKLNHDGTFSFKIPQGKHSLTIELQDTGIRLFSKWLTVGAILAIILLFVSRKKLIQ